VAGGLCTLAVVGGWMAVFRPLLRVDRFEGAAPPSAPR
jgi:hypothetical protein